MDNIAIIVQARLGSSRMPGKILKEIQGKSVLALQIERMQQSKYNNIIIATTTNPADAPVVEQCRKYGWAYICGDENDLLDRHIQAVKDNTKIEHAVKIPSDCPLIDAKIIDKVIDYYLANDYDYVSNLHPATYPDGNDVEIMKKSALMEAWEEATLPLEREHTTPFIWERPDRYRVGNITWNAGLDYSMSHRFTIDYVEDFQFIKAVFDHLYPKDPAFTLEDILTLLKEQPEIKAINEKYAGVNWYRNHLDELSTVDESMTKKIDQ